MFEDLASAMAWARKENPGCTLKVKAQDDGPTIVTIKCKGKPTQVAYVRQGTGRDHNGNR